MPKKNKAEARALLEEMYTSDILSELRRRGVVKDAEAQTLIQPDFVDRLGKEVHSFARNTHSSLARDVSKHLLEEHWFSTYWYRALETNFKGDRLWKSMVKITVVDTSKDNTIGW